MTATRARATSKTHSDLLRQLAEAIVTGGADDPLKTHRREVTVVFLDLHGFTAFAEMAFRLVRLKPVA